MALKIRLIAIAAGDRGNTYGNYVLDHASDRAEYVGVADPNTKRREIFSQKHNIDPEYQFANWEEVFSKPKFADAVVIATPDALHYQPAMQALDAQYGILLEKPMAATLDDNISLIHKWQESGRVLQVCHLLRYTEFYKTIYDVVQSGRLGKIITIHHEENVAYWHMAHSFVRGNWRHKDQSSPMILAKCCHDLDLLYWFVGEPIIWVSSVGSLAHFRTEEAPYPDVPLRCTDGCQAEMDCPFFAPNIYINHHPFNALYEEVGLPATEDPLGYKAAYEAYLIEGENPTPEQLYQALLDSPYGRCVYRCDNDVVDHQIVLMESVSGISIVLTMQGHSHIPSRITRIDGTRASLECTFSTHNTIYLHNHLTGHTETMMSEPSSSFHGGGDEKLMSNFLDVLENHRTPLTNPRVSLESHLMAFAAEQARLDGNVIDMNEFRTKNVSVLS